MEQTLTIPKILPVILVVLILLLVLGTIKRKIINSAEAQMLRYFIKAFKNGDINDKLASTPKSLSAMDSIFLPQIQKDFPEFNWNQFKPLIETAIRDMLQAIDIRDASLVSRNKNIYESVINVLAQSKIWHYKDVRTHRTVIKRYYKKDGTCYILTETSVEYFAYIEENGKVIRGQKDQKKQTVYETELTYIQDVQKTGTASGFGVHCPNCGAPIKNLGAKYCEYCGTGIETVNVKVWNINSIREA